MNRLCPGYRRKDGKGQYPAKIIQCTQAANRQLSVLEQQLQDRQYLLGDSFSIGDIPLGSIMYKSYNLDIERPSMPSVEAWYARLRERPAQQMHAMIPFGNSPQEWLALEQASA